MKDPDPHPGAAPRRERRREVEAGSRAVLGLIVTDLDGTLLDSAGRLSEANRLALVELGRWHVVRAVATGRSLYSARQVMVPEFPIDYLAFSSGAGVLDWPRQELLVSHHLAGPDAARASVALIDAGFDFMLHEAVPGNHRFLYHRTVRDNPDFERRLDRYREHARPLDGEVLADGVYSQIVAVEPDHSPDRLRAVRSALADLNVVRTTSPLDGHSTWIEVFPDGVSKSTAADWLRERHALSRAQAAAIGNDYNDECLLAWAPRAFVVANAAPALKARYEVVATNDEAGFAEAAAVLLAQAEMDGSG